MQTTHEHSLCNRVSATLSAEEWVCNAPNRIEDSHWEKRDAGGGLYTVLLEVADGEFFYGLRAPHRRRHRHAEAAQLPTTRPGVAMHR